MPITHSLVNWYSRWDSHPLDIYVESVATRRLCAREHDEIGTADRNRTYKYF